MRSTWTTRAQHSTSTDPAPARLSARAQAEAVALAEMMDRMALERGVPISRAIATEALALRGAAADTDQMALDLDGDDDE